MCGEGVVVSMCGAVTCRDGVWKVGMLVWSVKE